MSAIGKGEPNIGLGERNPFSRLEAALAERRTRMLALIVVLLATFLVYSDTLLFGFVYDDTPQIVQNQYVHGWSHWLMLFHVHVWAQQFSGGTYYRPFFLLLLLAEYSLFKLNPVGWHWISVLMHVGVTAGVYWVATKFTRTRWAALLAALLFGLDPIHVESVAWVSAITDPLATLFSLGAIVCYINFRNKQTRRTVWLAAAVLLFAGGLLSKETAIVVLPLLGLYEWFFSPALLEALYSKAPRSLGRFITRLRPLLIFAGITGLYLGARFMALHALGRQITPLPWQSVLYTAPRLLFFYAGHLLWPAHLSLRYPMRYLFGLDLRQVVVPWIALLVLLAAIVAVLWRRGSGTAKFFSWWLLLPILLVLDFRYFPAEELVHDRYLYFSSVGLVILAALGAEALAARLRSGRAQLRAAALGGALLVLALALAIGTVRESLPWSSNLTLYAHAAERDPRSLKARNDLCAELFTQHMYPQAIAECKIAVEIDGNSFAANYNLGNIYLAAGKNAEAEAQLRRATEIDPASSMAWNKLGESRLYQGNLSGAEQALRRALQLDSSGQGYHFDLGETLAVEGNLRAALAEYQEELRLHNDARARARIAEIKAALGN